MSNWNDIRINLLTKLWLEGQSASAIAAELGEGVTRNAVIGKVHRLKLASEKRPARPRVAKASRPSTPRLASIPRRAVAKAFAGVIDRSYAQVADAVATTPFILPPTHNYGSSSAILGLKQNKCKWPMGDPMNSDFRFCGGQADDHSPYCAHHRQNSVDAGRRRRQDREIMRMVG